jgi:hypothetical protein
VIWQTHRLLVSGWLLALIVAIWAISSALLRIKQDSLGAEGKYVDWWSLPHFTTGALFALVGVHLAFVVAIGIVWEVVEIFAHTTEYPTNRVVDIVLAVAGWATANALAGGAFAVY